MLTRLSLNPVPKNNQILKNGYQEFSINRKNLATKIKK